MTRQQIRSRIYPSIVTFKGDWRQMIKDATRLKLTAVSLFLTAAEYRERQEIYAALVKSTIKRIPHVHARNDMKEAELDLFVRHYKTKAFTIHYRYLKYFKNSKYLKKIFIENNNGKDRIYKLEPIKKTGGMCIDLSHLAEFKRHKPKEYAIAVKGVEEYRFKVGCNHVSAMHKDGNTWHYAKNVKEFDYLKDIPRRYFSQRIALEVGNPIPEQLKFCDYVTIVLTKQWNKKS